MNSEYPSEECDVCDRKIGQVPKLAVNYLGFIPARSQVRQPTGLDNALNTIWRGHGQLGNYSQSVRELHAFIPERRVKPGWAPIVTLDFNFVTNLREENDALRLCLIRDSTLRMKVLVDGLTDCWLVIRLSIARPGHTHQY